MVEFQRTKFSNGMRVVTERHPHCSALSVGVWVQTGTRDEKINQKGISHFLEHMVFKGTISRSGYQLVKDLEETGAEINAYTTREYTCYHAIALAEYRDLVLDVLSDLVLNAIFPKDEFERERKVILQEIAMITETPEDFIYDSFFENIFSKSSLGWPILGTESSLGQISLKSIKSYYKEKYTSNRMVISAVGNVDHDMFIKKVQKYFQSKKFSTKISSRRKAKYIPCVHSIEKNLEQIHMTIGFPIATFKDPYRMESLIFNAYLGGGMTSKLYQSIRERHGLAYSIYSSLATFLDTGICSVYVACGKTRVERVVDLIYREIKKVVKRGNILPSEIRLFKKQVKGSFLLASDDIENRMHSLGINEMVFKKFKSVDEVLTEIDSVTEKSMKNFVQKYLHLDRISFLILGDIKSIRWRELIQRQLER